MQTLEQVGGDEPNLFAALAQRRQRQGVAGEASQQILAERAALDELLEVSVCRRDDANVDAQGLRRAYRYDLALLQDAQENGLKRQRQVADLVEEDRSSVRASKEAGSILRRARERALLVPEQLALGERFGERAAIDGDEGTRPR